MLLISIIKANNLKQGDLESVSNALANEGMKFASGWDWVEPDSAAEIMVVNQVEGTESLNYEVKLGAKEHIKSKIAAIIPGADFAVQFFSHPPTREERVVKLLVADMDSTMITVECIDELADYAGIKAQIAAITEDAMNGRIGFEAALIKRVGLLENLPLATLEQCYNERVKIMAGAETLVRTVKKYGGRCLLVSGGFSYFANRVKQAIGFDQAIANDLLTHIISLNGEDIEALSGQVKQPIIGADAKLQELIKQRANLGLSENATLAIGDGANDIPMLKAASLGVAYRAKAKTAASAMAEITHHDLSATLWLMGLPRQDWVK